MFFNVVESRYLLYTIKALSTPIKFNSFYKENFLCLRFQFITSTTGATNLGFPKNLT
jgi:hypothetical protein